MDDMVFLSEKVEREALASLHASASPGLRERLGLRLETVGSALVSIAANDPGVVVNRAVGLGVGEAATPEAVETIARLYAEAGVGRYYVHLHPEAHPGDLRKWLADRGLERGRGWARFTRGDAPPPAARSDLRVRRIGPEHAAAFGRIAAEGFGLAKETASLLAGLATHPAWRIYAGFDGDEVAGAAGMFVHAGVAWFDWAATRKEFRRRGCQGALLRQRVQAALDLGCRRMLTETGEAVEGDPQHSYKNIRRAGFEILDVRENFVPAS